MDFHKYAKYLEWIILILILAISLTLSLKSSLQESAIMDELAHIPAGYSYVRFLDYRLNPEHPPLIKALSALPLLFEGLNFPTQSSAWQKDVNGQWEMGAKFLYESGNDADRIIQSSRIAPLLLTLLLAFFIYIWSRELIGRWWALFPTFLFALSPNILAHGHYVTTDVAAAFGIFIATYYLIKYLLHPSKKHIAYAGLAFGIAQLLKFSAVLLIPFFIFIVIVFYLWKGRNDIKYNPFFRGLGKFLKQILKAICAIIGIFVIGFVLVYVVYFLFTLNYPIQKQVSDTQFTLTSFADGPDPTGEACNLASGVSLGRHTRCLADLDIRLAGNPILRPFAQYLLGVLMVIQRSSGGNTSYFLGEVSSAGSWYYFPVVFALKEPIPSLLLIVFAFFVGFWSIIKKLKARSSKLKALGDYIATNLAEFSMISFVIFYWLYSIKSPLNIGMRHIFPTLPFIYILTAGAIKKWAMIDSFNGETIWKKIKSGFSLFFRASFKIIMLGAIIIWYAAEAFIAYPNFISYFNEFGGGKENGYEYVTDSNYDWGQDLKRLKNWVDEQNKICTLIVRQTETPESCGISKIAVDYFGGGNLKYYLGDKAVAWSSSMGNPALPQKNANLNANLREQEPIHWLAVSINSLQSAKGKLHPGQERNPADEYSWLQNPYEPYARIETSIFIYKL